IEALQNIRIKYRWEAIDLENKHMNKARKTDKTYNPKVFHNGDTLKQLLARSRYLLYKAQNNWTNSQGIRAKILFKQYPEIQKAYQLVQGLREIFNLKTTLQIAYTKLAHWYKQVE
ncbi:transposase, partial [Wenyingzhuangia sp. 2_MG-2023]|uniref:transposase n=1 Tax=Wenyingzhuangia sp. 2_MG-2023 TaxID=3062639 RepID=UPI0026E15C38